MEDHYFIFVPAESVNEEELCFSEVVDWGVQHRSHPNVLNLTEDDVYFLDYQTEVLSIVSTENGNSMVWVGEDDAVYEADIKRSIHARLSHYLVTMSDNDQLQKEPSKLARAQTLTRQILYLFEVAISTEKSIHFRF
ncbi:hypothetical protein [Hymenobacter volaticus]|uniref:Uncharacterized protein n=1 Tax=Hymenobacter volaticus TaxID=2932254 RepID=A0ABY4G192_9BACT|nr:hypothetical protein [Hymenobacter volaticus]UOQ64634.1 hypothetical protein MUN86_13710 [Hymenobacter volaticus]